MKKRYFKVLKIDPEWNNYVLRLERFIGKTCEFIQEYEEDLRLFNKDVDPESSLCFHKDWCIETDAKGNPLSGIIKGSYVVNNQNVTKGETVNNPLHYGGKDNSYETIKVLEATLSTEAYRGFLKGNCIKYLMRYEQKNGVEDLKKASWYTNKLIEHLEEKETCN